MSNEAKNRALGMNFSTASQRLRKLIMWSLVQRLGDDHCFQCGQKIVDVDDMSIEHKEPWQEADDPQATFFDLENTAFSHLSCNIRAGTGGGKANAQRSRCPQGHKYVGKNLYREPGNKSRHCRECRKTFDRKRQGYQNTRRRSSAR